MRKSSLAARCALTLLCAASVSAEPWMDPDRAAPSGTTYRTFKSKTIGEEVSYLIYLPPDYETAKSARYPVIYYLHGLFGTSAGSAREFVSHLDAAIRQKSMPPAIAVMVNGVRDSRYVDSFDGQRPVETVIVKDLIPHVDDAWRTVAKREARAIEGFSMGGFGAARLGFKFPELFGAVSILGVALLDEESVRTTMFPELYPKNFGSNRDYFIAQSPWTLAEVNAKKIAGKTFVRMVVGADDDLKDRNVRFHQLLERAGIPHEFVIVPNVAHDGIGLQRELAARGFEFYRRVFAKLAAAGPQ
jgi:enterochelin esterase-like enzyme